MKRKELFRAIYFAIGVLVAFILFRLDLPLSDRAKTW